MNLIPVFVLIVALGAGIAWYEKSQADAFEAGETQAVATAALEANARLGVAQDISRRLSAELEETRVQGEAEAEVSRRKAAARVRALEGRIAELEASKPPECPAPCSEACYLLEKS